MPSILAVDCGTTGTTVSVLTSASCPDKTRQHFSTINRGGQSICVSGESCYDHASEKDA